MRPLLRVSDTFALKWGLVLAPDIPFASRGFKPFSHLVTIIAPDGTSREVQASFSLTHFRPGGYKLMVTLPSESPGSIQIGSLVHADEEVHSMLTAEQA